MCKSVFTPSDGETGLRLDIFLVSRLSDYSRSMVQRAICLGQVMVGGKIAKANYKLRPRDLIEFNAPPPAQTALLPKDIPLDILYEDSAIIVINKPQGMVVHPGAGNREKTLVNALLFHCGGHLSGVNDESRPGIVHRIDKDTSGILVAAKNDTAHRRLAEQFHEHSVKRRYIAVVRGIIENDKGTLDAPIGRSPNNRIKMAVNHKNGKRAVTHYTVLERLKRHTLLEAALETGRTHQIRVHLSAISHPLAGDYIYGGAFYRGEPPLNGQALHAGLLGFVHPDSGVYMEYTAPPPEYFTQLLAVL